MKFIANYLYKSIRFNISNNSTKSIKLFKEFNKLTILSYSKIFIFKELFAWLITITIIIIKDIK